MLSQVAKGENNMTKEQSELLSLLSHKLFNKTIEAAITDIPFTTFKGYASVYYYPQLSYGIYSHWLKCT